MNSFSNFDSLFHFCKYFAKIIFREPGCFCSAKRIQSRAPSAHEQGTIIMAKDASLKDVSKTELAEAYARLKAKGKAQQMKTRKEGEELIRDGITVGSGALVGYLMGQREARANLTPGMTPEAQAEELAKTQQVGGVDMDLLIGGGAAVVGLMKLGGKMSDAVRAVGIGALAEYAGRMAYDKGIEAEKEE